MRAFTVILALMLSGLLLQAQIVNSHPEEPKVTNESQIITLSQGWAGISSYLDPANPEVANLMSTIEEKLIIIRDIYGNYYQPASKNTLINWDFKQGYFIKITSSGNLEIEGLYSLSRQFDLQTGWNLIPVLSDIAMAIEEYFFDHLDKIEIVTEVAGINVFWPEMDISTLEILVPGKAYLVKAVAPFTLFQLPEVVTAEVTNITSISATCGGEALHEGSSAVIERGVVWSTLENPTIDDYEGITYNGEGVGSWLSELTAINPQTTYFVRAYAKNHVGTAYGEQESFVTQQQVGFTCGDPLVDARDSQTYATVQIGDQCWMAENLAYLPAVSPSSQGSNTDPYYYVYGYHGTDVNVAKATDNYNNYGALYNWPASLGACPEGWHLPTDNEWTVLVDYVVAQGFPNQWNDPNGAGNALKSCRQVNSPLGGGCNTTQHPRWNYDDTHHGFDAFGFSGLPGGYRDIGGYFNGMGTLGPWWSSNEYSTLYAWYRTLDYSNAIVLRYNFIKGYGFSVRCLRD